MLTMVSEDVPALSQINAIQFSEIHFNFTLSPIHYRTQLTFNSGTGNCVVSTLLGRTGFTILLNAPTTGMWGNAVA